MFQYWWVFTSFKVNKSYRTLLSEYESWFKLKTIYECLFSETEQTFFSRTAGTISTKLGIQHPWMIGIQDSRSPVLSQRGDDKERAKIRWRNWNTLFPNQWTNIDQTWHTSSLDEGNSGLFKWSEGCLSFQRGDNKEQSKIYWRNIKKCNNIVIWNCTLSDL